MSGSEYAPPSGSQAVATADSRQFVRVEFARALGSIKAGQPRHPWHWCLIIQDGHIYAISDSFATMEEAVADFGEQGIKRVVEAEALLASMYCGPHERPYDVAVVNPENQ